MEAEEAWGVSLCLPFGRCVSQRSRAVRWSVERRGGWRRGSGGWTWDRKGDGRTVEGWDGVEGLVGHGRSFCVCTRLEYQVL